MLFSFANEEAQINISKNKKILFRNLLNPFK